MEMKGSMNKIGKKEENYLSQVNHKLLINGALGELYQDFNILPWDDPAQLLEGVVGVIQESLPNRGFPLIRLRDKAFSVGKEQVPIGFNLLEA